MCLPLLVELSGFEYIWLNSFSKKKMAHSLPPSGGKKGPLPPSGGKKRPAREVQNIILANKDICIIIRLC